LEALAIVWSFKRFRAYLQCSTTLVFTDHSFLKWLAEAKDNVMGRIWRWSMYLQQFNYQVFYVPGSTNLAADALSRHPLPMVHQVDILSLSIHDTHWLKAQELDPFIKEVKKKWKNNMPSTTKRFTVTNDLLFHIRLAPRNRQASHLLLVVPQQLIKQYHSSIWTGHYGTMKTLKRLGQARFWWPSLIHDVKIFCRQCQLCQQTKTSTKRIVYPLKQTSSSAPWAKTAMDFFGPLPASQLGNKYVLVVIDTFSRYVELYALATNSQAYLANIIYHQLVPRHGLPMEFLSDNGAPFASDFITTLDTNTLFAPPFHQQANGIAERFMGILRRLIISYIEQEHIGQQWDRLLQFFAFAHNTTYLDVIGNTPFFVCH
jgi:transposase InsO family protein